MTTGIVRTTLPNGLRVLIERRTGGARTAVSVHYGVGYRSEPPGREGFAHLFEHLMFRGSANLPTGAFFERLHQIGGSANGSTHQDYTDYYQVVPAAALEQALFGEADRMRSPRFTEQTLAEQLDGIETEIRQAVHDRPYGGLPWPLLPGVLYRRFANAHDGYGDLSALRRCTVADCAEFFHHHYPPGNAVLTVVGDHDPTQVLRLVERHFGDIPSRPVAARPELREPVPTGDRWVTCTEPQVPATALAIGYRLPDPRTDLPGYLAHLALAELVGPAGPGTAGSSPGAGAGHDADRSYAGLAALSASCGYFGPLDARDPDTLVLTAVVAPGADPEQAATAVRQGWDRWADTDRRSIATGLDHVVRQWRSRHHRGHADSLARCRALGRLELLFDHPELLDELPNRLAETTPEQLSVAAAGLGSAGRAVLAMVPGNSRSRPPRPAADMPARPLGTATAVAATDPPHHRRQPPPIGRQPEPFLGPHAETVLANGLPMVAVRDDRAPLVELRLRLPLGPVGWWFPQYAAVLARHLVERDGLAARAGGLGGGLEVVTDGQWLDLAGHAPAGRVGDLLDLLAGVLTPAAAGPPLPPAAGLARDPGSLVDDAVRRHWLGLVPGRPADGLDVAELGLADVHRCLLEQGQGWLVAVGAIDPERLLDLADRVAARWPALAARRAYRPDWSGGGVILCPAPGRPRLSLSAPEPETAGTEPARYLATALTGSYHRSRLDLRAAEEGWIHEGASGRDVCLSVPRAHVWTRLPAHDPVAALTTVRAELAGLVSAPLTPAEVDEARGYCAMQLLAAFDSPASKADMIRQGVSAGKPAAWLRDLPGELREVEAAAVVAASQQLFDLERLVTVVSGEPESVGRLSEVAERLAGHSVPAL